MKKIAVCVGINRYPDHRNNLWGCVNDAKGFKSLLLEKYGFDKVILILDRKATYRNVVKNIRECMLELEDLGHFVFTVSSHGTSVKDRSGDEKDGLDEAICLYDRLLIDDTFRTLLNDAPVGMKCTVIADCCHSGSITRLDNSDDNEYQYKKIKYLPFDDTFVSVKKSKPSNKIFVPQSEMNEVLITGCKSDEYSYDTTFNGKNHGALSYTILDILKDGPQLTYNELYKSIKDKLPSSQLPQSPQLEGSDTNKNMIVFS